MNAGNKLLRALHDLDIDDKHKKLLDTEKVMEISIQGQYHIDDLQNAKIDYDCNSIKHYFEKDSQLTGLPVIETIEKIIKEINGIVMKFKVII